MGSLRYIIDDFDAANLFVKQINRKVLRQRFSAPGQWAPDRLMIAEIDGEMVAMADCILSGDGKGANGSILAKPGRGGHAVSALLRLKKAVGAEQWGSTLRVPTPATVAISRRYFDISIDQIAWDIASKLIEVHGPLPHLTVMPLFVSRSYLKDMEIPHLNRLDEDSKRQVLLVARSPTKFAIRSPNNKEIGPNGLMPLAFDLLDLSMPSRQGITRSMIIMTAAAYGHPVDPHMARKVIGDASMPSFMQTLMHETKAAHPGNGIFHIEPQSAETVANVNRFLATGRI